MHAATNSTSPAIDLKSSILTVDSHLREMGVFRYSHEYVRDRDFDAHVLTPQLTNMDAVHAFVASLDADNQATTWKSGCSKAHSFRTSMKYVQNVTTELKWALNALARARRTCCSCHDNGSFHKR